MAAMVLSGVEKIGSHRTLFDHGTEPLIRPPIFFGDDIDVYGTLFEELCGLIAKQKFQTHTMAELGHAFRQS
jgi:hypothetical protein